MIDRDQLSHSARRVQDALQSSGLEARVVELPASTRTVREAAKAIGCSEQQIAKSIIFQSDVDEQAVLVIASGSNHIDVDIIEHLIGGKIRRATPEFVRQQTGFAIGGVPPCGHSRAIRTFIDKDLLSLGSVWAAAGTPHAVFELDPAQLPNLTGGTVITVC